MKVDRMPNSGWFVQVHPVGGKPKVPVVFSDFEKLFAFVDEFKKSGSSDTVRVHLPESATNKEKEALDKLGVKMSLLS